MPSLRPYRAGDETGIRALFETCHQRPLSEDVWRWRYGSEPEGPAVITVAEHDGRIVGHVGALRASLDRDAHRMAGAMWVDLMVHPEHRNLDLFLEMADANRRQCAAEGVEALFAFPNDKSFPVMKRMLDWAHIAEIHSLEAPLAQVRVPSSAPLAPSQPGRDVDALWPELRAPGRWTVVRTAKRQRWRYQGRPGGRYDYWAAPGGWLAAKVFDGPRGKIGDVLDFWTHEETGAALLSAALARFREAGVATVSAWALPGTPQHARLSAAGLKMSEDVTHFAGRWTADSRADFPSSPDDWCPLKGDSDVF